MKKKKEQSTSAETTADESAIRNPQSKIAPSPKASLIMIEVDAVVVKDNARSSMDEDSLFQLADSVKSVGQLEPVIVHKVGKKLVMIAGHRRLAAAKQNQEHYIEAKVYDTLDDAMVARMQLTENLQREDLNHIDIARQLGVARDARMTNAQIAAEINTSADYVRKHLDLLRLAEPVQQLVASGRLPVKQAELIARVGDPKKQIDLAENATSMEWIEREEAWRHDLDTIDEKIDDYVQPMDELRKCVGYKMQGLAACGWPQGEQFAGKRPCENCPDNTATYADQPMLFAGISPQGSAKKGHCTNEACYKAKTIEQNKVREARRKAAEKKTAAKVAKAKKVGLAVCEGCTKVSEPDELVEDRGRMLCKKCVEKQRAKDARGYDPNGGGESYQQREKRVASLKRKFPWQADQKFAKALHDYGMNLVKAIGKHLKGCGDHNAPPDAEKIILWAAVAGDKYHLAPIQYKLMPTLGWLVGGCRFSAEALSLIWQEVECSDGNQPHVDYSGNVRDVPLPDEHVEYIGELEALAKHWDVKDLPERPTSEDIEHAEIIEVIRKGKKPEALAAIAACEDAELLKSILDKAVKFPVWRVKACRTRIEQLTGKGKPEEKKKKPTTLKATKKKAKASASAKSPTAGKTSRVNGHGVLTDTERFDVVVPKSKRVKLAVEVALAPDGRWARGVSVLYAHAASGFGYSYSPSLQTVKHDNRREAILAGLNEVAATLRSRTVGVQESKSVAADVRKALAAVEGSLAALSPTADAEAGPALQGDESEPGEQLGHIDKSTVMGRTFEIEKPDGSSLELTLIKWTKKEYTFLNVKGGKVRLGADQWGMIWLPNCTGYTDVTGDFGIISDGPKELALVHIAWADLATLKHADRVGVKGDWRRAAVRKRIEKLEKAATDGNQNTEQEMTA